MPWKMDGWFAGPKTVNRAAMDSGLFRTSKAAILGRQCLTAVGTRIVSSGK